MALHDPELPERTPESIGLPTARVFHDTGFVYIRDSWKGVDQLGGDTVFRMQSGGGGRSRSHEHFDKNSYSLYAKGEYFIVDPGHSCYRGKSHHEYDTRTRNHNTITVDGKDQNLEFVERGMLHDEVREYTSYHTRAEVVSKDFYNQEVVYVASDGRKCYQPFLKDFMRKTWYVDAGYFILWDRVDIGDQTGNMENGFNINNIDGKMEYKINGNNLLVSRPKADLSMQFLAPQKLQFEVSDAKLHTAYHIYPDKEVESPLGSATRFNLKLTDKELKAADFVYVIAPLDKGAAAPEVTILEASYKSDKSFMFDSLRIQIEFNGKKDVFAFDNDYVQFKREGGVYYSY